MHPVISQNTKAIVAAVAENTAQHVANGQIPQTLEEAIASVGQSLVVAFLVWLLPNRKPE